jgi:hypothetical protein
MAKTKQTARVSTGGKAPRADIARRAAREPRQSALYEAVVDITYDHGRFIVRRPGGSKEDIPEPSARDRLGPEVINWLKLRAGKPLNQEVYRRWSLGDWIPRRDSEAESDGQSPVFLTSDLFAPALVRLRTSRPAAYEASTSNNPTTFYRIVFCSLFDNESIDEQARCLDVLDSWCLLNRGKPYQLTQLGCRSSSVSELPEALKENQKIVYRTRVGGCAPAAVANLIYSRDKKEARIIWKKSQGSRFLSLRALASWLEKNSKYELRRAGVESFSPAQKKTHLMEQKHGQYVVILTDGVDSDLHVVGVDAHRLLVYDSQEEFTMKLSQEALDRSVGSGLEFVGILDIREVVRKRCPLRKKRGAISK